LFDLISPFILRDKEEETDFIFVHEKRFLSLKFPRVVNGSNEIISPTVINEFFELLEFNRRAGNVFQIAEIQKAKSGIMIDFDIEQENKLSDLNNEFLLKTVKDICFLIKE